MTRSARSTRPTRPTRLVLAVLAAFLVLVTAACSDAPTEKEIAMADDGVDPSIVQIFTSPELLTIVSELGTLFLIDRPGITFLYTAKDPATLTQRVDEGREPALWIDRAEALAPIATRPIAKGAPVRVGDNVMQFLVSEEWTGEAPTLETFGDASSPTKTVLIDPSIPSGASAQVILQAAGVTPAPDATVPVAKDAIVGVALNDFQTTLAYRSDAARFVTKFDLIPLPDPKIGARTYQSLRLSDDATGAAFQTWLDESPEAAVLLVKRGFRTRPAAKSP